MFTLAEATCQKGDLNWGRHTIVILAPRRLRQEGGQFKVNLDYRQQILGYLDYTVTDSLIKKKKAEKRSKEIPFSTVLFLIEASYLPI